MEREALDGPRAAGIIGRELERAQIDAWLQRPGGGARVLMIEGGPGTGRTLLWRDSLTSAHKLGYRVLRSRPSESDSTLSFSVLGDLLANIDRSLIDVLPTPQRLALLAALLQVDVDGPIPMRGVALGLLSILRQMALAAPLLIAIDDVHWIDETSAHALTFALRRIDHEPVLLLAALRTGPSAGSRYLALPDNQRQSLRLEPLSEEGMGEVLRAHLGAHFSWPAAAEVHRAAGGNPAVGLEIGRALQRGEIRLQPAEPLPLPRALRSSAQLNVAGLPASSLDALLVVAALAQPAVGLVERLLGRGSQAALRMAAEQGLVEVAGDEIRVVDAQALSFIYWDASPDRRTEIHRQLAEVLPDRAQQLRHLALSSRGSVPRLARELEEAAARTAEGGALRAAGDLAQLTLRLTHPRDGAQIGRRRLLAAELRLATGDAAGVNDLLEVARSGTLPGSRQAHLLRILAQARLLDSGARSSVEAVAGVVGEAGQAERIAAEASEHLAVSHLLAGDVLEAGAHGGRPAGASVDEQFESLQQVQARLDVSPGQPGRALLQARLAIWGDDLPGAVQRLRELERQAREAGNALVLPLLLARLAEAECWLGSWLEAAVQSHRGCQLAMATSQRALRAHHLYVSALADVHRGMHKDAREAALRGEELAAGAGFRPLAVLNRAVLGHLELSLGNPAAAQLDFMPLVESRWAPGTEPGLARFLPDAIEVLVAQGDLEHAGRLVSVLEPLARQLGVRWPLASMARCRALLEAAIGRHDEAQRWFWQAIDEDRRLGRNLDLGRDLLAQGVALRHQRNHRSARAALEHAVAVFAQLGTRPWSERARSELSRVAGQGHAAGELDPVERRVAELVAQGLESTEIAGLLFLQIGVVQSHLKAVYRKLGVRSRVALAYRLGVRPR